MEERIIIRLRLWINSEKDIFLSAIQVWSTEYGSQTRIMHITRIK